MNGEHNDPHIESINIYTNLPWIVRKAWESLLRLFEYTDKATMYACQRKLPITEYEEISLKREQFAPRLQKDLR